MYEPDGTFRSVDVLTAGTAGTSKAYVDVGRVDVDVDRVVDHRIDGNGREARVAPGVGIERRDAHQPVHACFGLEPAVRVLAFNFERGRLDARFFARALVDQLDLIAAPLAPPHVHAGQHLCPVLAFRSAGAGVDFDIGIHAVGFAGQHRLDALALNFLVKAPQCAFAFGDGRFVVLGFAKLDQRQVVLELTLQTAEVGQRALKLLALPHDLLREGWVVPKRRIFRALVEIG